MFQGVVDFVKASRPAQFALVFLAGGVVASVFYPTKHIEEKLQKTYQQQISTLTQQHSQELSKMQTTYEAQSQTLSQTNMQLTSKVNALTDQVTNLKTHQSKTFYKIVHPDGTIEERASSVKDSDEEQQITQQVQSEVDQKVQASTQAITSQFSQQISEMQKTWDSKEQTYQKTISTLTQSKVEDTNKKNFTLDVGALTNADYYGHVSYNLLGPIVIGLQGQFGTSPAAGAGIGLTF
jgi:ATP-dependent Lon protease